MREPFIDRYREDFVPDGNLLRKGAINCINCENATEIEQQRNEQKLLDWFSRAIPARFFDPGKVTFTHKSAMNFYWDDGAPYHVLKTVGSYKKPLEQGAYSNV